MDNPGFVQTSAGSPEVTGFLEPRSGSVQYVVSDPATGRAAVIDPVLDFEPNAAATATRSADALLAHLEARDLRLDWILDTHPHADHLSAAAYLAAATGAPTAIGERVVEVQKLWKAIYDLPDSFPTDGSQWSRLLADGDRLRLGSLDIEVMLTPGHTLASVAYCIGDAAFIHDTLFMPDSGTARTDFPGGSASALWRSIGRILALPDGTRLFSGHDYRPGGRPPAWESTVAGQRSDNAHLLAAPTEDAFVAFRQARDRTLPMPKLILHALQVNIAGGRLPDPQPCGRRFLKIPIDALPGPVWGD